MVQNQNRTHNYSKTLKLYKNGSRSRRTKLLLATVICLFINLKKKVIIFINLSI